MLFVMHVLLINVKLMLIFNGAPLLSYTGKQGSCGQRNMMSNQEHY